MKRVLVLDDNLTICLMLKSWLKKENYIAESASNVNEAIELVKSKPFDLILSDIRMPEADGFSFLSWIKRYDSDILVIMMTGFADVESAVESMKLGAVDYISKPIDPDTLFRKINEAFENYNRNVEKRKAQNMFIMPPGENYNHLFAQLDFAAQNAENVLICGNTGTGKKSAAQYIYEKSSFNRGPFITLDCTELQNSKCLQYYNNGNPSPIDEALASAKGGVLFIQNPDNLDSISQDKILSGLTNLSKKDELLIIAASDKVNGEVKKRLIPKLYNCFEDCMITMPSMKGHEEAIMFFANYFLNFANNELNKRIEYFSPEVVEAFIQHDWQGNIQEIKNTVLKAALLTEGAEVKKELASGLFKNSMPTPVVEKGSEINVEALRKENYEREKIGDALELAKGNKTLAASILNIDRKTLYNKIRLYQIELTN